MSKIFRLNLHNKNSIYVWTKNSWVGLVAIFPSSTVESEIETVTPLTFWQFVKEWWVK